MTAGGAEQVTPEEVRAQASNLRSYATHFALSDWAYTRDTGRLRPLRYEPWHVSLRRAAGRLIARDHNRIFPGLPDMRPSRWALAKASWRNSGTMPDGVLDNGGVLTIWEETGEYLQKVQPSVGALLADLMDAHPELPEVQAIATEMKRIADDYSDRVASGQALGRGPSKAHRSSERSRRRASR